MLNNKKLKSYLSQKSTWTGAGSLMGLSVLLGIPSETFQVVGAAVVAILNLFDVLRDEQKNG